MSNTETHPTEADPTGRALAAIGLSEAEESAYLVLLEHPGASLDEVTDLAQLPRRQANRVLAELEAKGMITRSLDRDTRFQPAPPDAAVDELIARRQRQLNVARWHAQRLAEQARAAAGRRDGHEIVEMVSGTDAVASYWERLHADTTRESLAFLHSPVAPSHKGAVSALAKDVPVRVIYDRDGLTQPRALAALRGHVDAGEQARVFAPLPVEMAVVDRRIAMIHLINGTSDAVGLLLRPCGLLDALIMFFEAIWQQASPFTLTAEGEIELSGTETNTMPSDVERILPLLAVGLKDDCIARELGVSARTLDRRLRAMMHAWGAATRFQAGWLAASKYQPTHAAGNQADRQDDCGDRYE